jgi:hypothetical protein
MLSFPNAQNACRLSDRLRDTALVTPSLFQEIVDEVCRRFPSSAHSEKSARIEQLIDANAWTEAALALIELELPQWQLRRIAYDGGEWFCALSREREFPDWLDQSIEAQHPDLALSLLAVFVEAQALAAASSRPSVPAVPRKVPAST